MNQRYHRHEEGEVEGVEENPYIVAGIGPSVPNYYGDYVRRIFFISAAAMLILSPFIDSEIPILMPVEIIGALIFAILGAFTSPTNQVSILANAAAAIAGVLVYEGLALLAYAEESYIVFIEREALAIGFLVALYFSVKTLRNMVTGRVGKRDSVSEFLEPGDQRMMQPGDGD
jgi:hypothetical protein